MVDVGVVRALPEFLNETVLGFQKMNVDRLQVRKPRDMRLRRRFRRRSDLLQLGQESGLQRRVKAFQLAHPRKRLRPPHGAGVVWICHEIAPVRCDP